LRVAFVTWKDVAHPLAGGSEVLIHRVATGLHQRGHDVTVVAGGPIGEHEYRTVDAGHRYAQYLTNPVRVRRSIDGPDVIVDVFNGLPFFSPLWSDAAVVAHVNHIHFGMWREWFSPLTALVGSSIETKVAPCIYRSRRIVTVSESSARTLRTLGVPAEQISTVSVGVDGDIAPRGPAASSEEPTFIAIGRLVPHKRFDLLLRAWRTVREELGTGRLDIVGDGPLRAQLEHDLPPGTRLLGHVSDAEKRLLLRDAWALVQPSRLEGWGIVVMEAAREGTPTLGFRVPGTRDAVVHGETGVLVRSERDLVEAWIGLSRDPERRELLAEGAHRRAAAFTWERTIDEYEAALVRAVAEQGPPGGQRLAGAIQLGRRSADRVRTGASEAARLVTEGRQRSGSREHRRVESLPFALAGRELLYIGDRSDATPRHLRERGADVVSVERSRFALDTPRSADRPPSPPGLRRYEFPDATFDGVVCATGAVDLVDGPALLAEIGRLLRPGGWAWLGWTPTRSHRVLQPVLQRQQRHWSRFEHLVHDVAAESQLVLRDAYPCDAPALRSVLSFPPACDRIPGEVGLVLERGSGDHSHVHLDTRSPRALVRRSLRRARRLLGDDPRFLPIVLRATPIGPNRAVTRETDLVVEGFPRSGNTFAHFAATVAEPDARIVSRVHTPSQVKQAVRLMVPTLLVIRSPIPTIASLSVATTHVPFRSVLHEYIHHYEQLLPLVDDVVVATFDEVTTDFDRVIDALNERFGLGFRPFGHTPDRVAEVFRRIERHHTEHWGQDRRLLPVPAEERGNLSARIRRDLERPEFESLVAEAQSVHDALAAHSITRRTARPSPVHRPSPGGPR
jgi:glycosyltransferase involved in cell wall biosynthesis